MMHRGLVRRRAVWFSRLLFSLSVMIGMASCASYGRKQENPSYLNTKNVTKIEGVYHAKTVKDSIQFSTGEWYVYQHNFLRELDRTLWRDTLGLDTMSDYSFKLDIKSPKTIRVSYIKNDSVFRNQILKTKLTKKGYLQLKNKNLKFMGVPYIFGGHDHKRVRLTVDDNGNLVMDSAEGSYGSMMLIFGGSSSSSHRFLFSNKDKG